MIAQTLKQYLEKEELPYEVHRHPDTYTAQMTAWIEHVSGKRVAKVVMLKAGGENLMAVLPANKVIDLGKLAAVAGKPDLRIAEESEFRELFPGIETGAMPPFGELYHLPCYVDISLLEGGKIYFAAGNHHETVLMRTEDFGRAAKAVPGDFSRLP